MRCCGHFKSNFLQFPALIVQYSEFPVAVGCNRWQSESESDGLTSDTNNVATFVVVVVAAAVVAAVAVVVIHWGRI